MQTFFTPRTSSLREFYHEGVFVWTLGIFKHMQTPPEGGGGEGLDKEMN